MQMGNVTFPAEITDCDNCEQNFLNSTRMGRWTTKLWRSKAITGTNFRVLTVSKVLSATTPKMYGLRFHRLLPIRTSQTDPGIKRWSLLDQALEPS